jgi:hypothetical protein
MPQYLQANARFNSLVIFAFFLWGRFPLTKKRLHPQAGI